MTSDVSAPSRVGGDGVRSPPGSECTTPTVVKLMTRRWNSQPDVPASDRPLRAQVDNHRRSWLAAAHCVVEIDRRTLSIGSSARRCDTRMSLV